MYVYVLWIGKLECKICLPALCVGDVNDWYECVIVKFMNDVEDQVTCHNSNNYEMPILCFTHISNLSVYFLSQPT